MEIIPGDLYDYPSYYDLVYGSDWRAEFDFLLAVFERHARRPVRRVFEPACGTGRLLYRLAARGYDVAGLDLNPRMVEYCQRRLDRQGGGGKAVVGDMADFRLRPPADAAFNMINSFRHLATAAQARAHLDCVAAAVRRGGLYVLGLHLTPTAHEPLESESWSARRGHLSVIAHVWTLARDLAKRQERVGMAYDIYTPTRRARIEGESLFRTYTAPQLRRLLAAAPAWKLQAAYDFAYEIEQPVEIDAATEDVVLVLERA